jgi:hypothetical protein
MEVAKQAPKRSAVVRKYYSCPGCLQGHYALPRDGRIRIYCAYYYAPNPRLEDSWHAGGSLFLCVTARL